jgi:hypothetical protein
VCAIVRRSSGTRRGYFTQARQARVELPDLAVCTPACKATARIAKVGAGSGRPTAGDTESRGQLVCDAFVLDKAVLAGRFNRLFVQMHGVEVPTFDAGDLGRHQGVLVGKRRRIVVGPFAQLFAVPGQELAPPGLLVGGRVIVERGHRQRGVVNIVDHLELADYAPQPRVRLLRGGEGGCIVARQEPRLQLYDPVSADQRAYPVVCQLCLERRLVELRVAEGG